MKFQAQSPTAKWDNLVLAFIFSFLFYSCTRNSPTDPTPNTSTLRITSINPTSGTRLSLDTIYGIGFNENAALDSAFFGGVAANILNAKSTQLIVQVPAAANTGKVSIHVNGNVADGPTFMIQALSANAPSITSFMLPIGKPGDKVTIVGINFNDTANKNTVQFNGATAAVTNASSSQLTAVVPQGATTGRISINVGGQLAVSGSNFTVINPVVTTFAGDAPQGFVDGSLLTARFSNPEGIAIDSSGNLYVADEYNLSIRKITPAGIVSTIAMFQDVSSVTGLTVGTDGTVYAVERYHHSVYKVPPGGAATLVSGIGLSGYLDDTIPHAMFNEPFDITADALGNLFIADRSNNRIRKISPDGLVTTFAGSDTALTYDGVGVLSTFNRPKGITIDNSGNLFVAEYSKIRKITPAGVVTTISGNDAGFADGLVSSAKFYLPKGITVDNKGNIFVTDRTRIREITKDGYVITIAGTGEFGFADGIGSEAKFFYADGVVVDKAGNLYVADPGNNRIRKITFQ